ncbi:hypothetical protein E4N83_04460 [Treponema denticola]|uniref:plasmid fertility inhibition factor family protein n=1 Tax=Treponema denticola TaxID=158 RepID=UPI0020A50C1B|nr:hypothetical protein [Treponema denticola]UTC92452.1 hypothetical protein E4N84_04830 [Treponema denticola]UTC95010.1 hypothetical protein E4N85_04365 [Treponema denticola]UTC97540.1 hypothetical protein E4N83_04460 [Treponema denticola]
MKKIDGLNIYRNANGCIIFELIGNKKYYMSSCEKLFIILEATYFDRQWKKTNFKIQKLVANIKDKKDDCKYQDAKEGFAQGENNPVPVVNIDIQIENNNDIIPTLRNGLTRTNFLLANNVKYLVFSISRKLLLDDADSYFFIKNDEI